MPHVPPVQLTETTARRYWTEPDVFWVAGTQFDDVPEVTSQQVPRNWATVNATTPGFCVHSAGPAAPCGAGSHVGMVALVPSAGAAFGSLA